MTQDMCLDISKSKDCIRNKIKIGKKIAIEKKII